MELFGRFRLVERLAAGGMCEVFLVQDPVTPAPMVLKRLLPELEKDKRAMELFTNEGEIGTILRHPNIVTVVELGMVERHPYVLMELVDGPDVSDLQAELGARQQTINIKLAIYITLQMLDALSYAHFATRPNGEPLGIIHRDVSPDNLFCSRAGVVKLADFGIAKLSAVEFFTDPRLGIRGKMSFMAPERLRGDPLDGRADEFSAALVLYELCTGVRPYGLKPGENIPSLRKRVEKADIPRPRKLLPVMPRKLESIIMTALEPDARNRYATCRDFAMELRALALKEDLYAGAPELRALIEKLLPATVSARRGAVPI
ncbi:MAG: serine/threonine-protein kinase [Myxococcota bacterium]